MHVSTCFLHVSNNLEIQVNNVLIQDVLPILSRKDIGKKAKSEKLYLLFGIEKNKEVKCFIDLLCGCDSSSEKLFGYEKENSEPIKFSNISYEDSIPGIQEKISEDEYSLIEQLKIIYDYASVSMLLEDGKYEFLSQARVAMFDKHNKDLKKLKMLYKKYLPLSAYNHMFRSDGKGTYSAYVNSVLADGKKVRRNFEGRDYESIKATIVHDFDNYKEEQDVKLVFAELKEGTFLPKQITGANGIIPNQLHRKELKRILENAEGYLPFLKEKDESGLSVSQRIVALFSFQIPYYVGPTGLNSKNNWAVRKEEGPILPWNIWTKIDKKETSQKFILRMIRNCSYLNDEKVLPKSSLLYEEYCVLNEINCLKICGERVDAETKSRIFSDLFLVPNAKRIKRKAIVKYLIESGKLNAEDELTGIDETLNNYLSSYSKLYSVFGDRLKEDSVKSKAEEIIFYGTIYGDSKEMFKESIYKFVEDGTITQDNLKRILGYKFKDWGRLSKEMLLLTGCDKSTGEKISLIQALREYSLNFEELINSNDFSFKESLIEKQTKTLSTIFDFSYQDLDEFYLSAPVKRMVWQSISLIKEITEIVGNIPDKLFIETTRSDEEKGKRTISRSKQLLALYDSIKNVDIKMFGNDINVNIEKLTKELKDSDKDDFLKSKELFLYYMQLGKDLYTGEDIDLSELHTKYDIDHIYPRSKAGKDDSLLNNLVLVNKRANADIKKDFYPIPAKISANPKVRSLWSLLHSIKTDNGQRLLSDEKYGRLIRKDPLSDEELSHFIARQLVETGQATKKVGNIFQQIMPKAKIVFSKAGNVSDFRKNNNFLKSRLLNEFHHAKDAYLNIVVGNAYEVKFTQDPRKFIDKEFNRDREKNRYNLDNSKMFERLIERNGKTAWIPGKDGTILTVENVMNKNTPIISNMIYDQKGGFYKIQPVSHNNAKEDNYAPLKTGMSVERYGGYQSITPSYFVFIEYDVKKGKRKKAFESVPGMIASKIKEDDDLVKYFEQKYSNVRIVVNHIKKESLINYNGFYFYIAGLDSKKRVEFHNATPFCLNNKWSNYVHYIEKADEKGIIGKLEDENNNSFEGKQISKEKNISLFDEIIHKYTSSIFKKYPGCCAEKISSSKELFESLSLPKQTEILLKLFKISSFEKGIVDLSEFNEMPKEAGRIRMAVDASKANSLVLINQSISGLIEKKIDLLSC